eukprot:4367012-Amphidinium_carterae.1
MAKLTACSQKCLVRFHSRGGLGLQEGLLLSPEGVNSVVRAKLLRCHLQRLGYTCRIMPVFDKREIVAYVLQVELPMPR